MSVAVVPTPTPPTGTQTSGAAAPSPARRVVKPVALTAKGEADGMSDRVGSPTGEDRAGSPSRSAGSPLPHGKVKWSKLPSLMRKMKVVNDLKKGSAVVGANVEWGEAVATADRLSSRIHSLREKSNALGFQLDPRLLEEVFQTADALVDLTPMTAIRKKKERSRRRKGKRRTPPPKGRTRRPGRSCQPTCRSTCFRRPTRSYRNVFSVDSRANTRRAGNRRKERQQCKR